MSSTPLFDSIALSTDRPTAETPAVATPAVASPRPIVPPRLVADIEAIVTQRSGSVRITDDQRALVDAIGDSLIRVVVDSLSEEIERIVRERLVHGL